MSGGWGDHYGHFCFVQRYVYMYFTSGGSPISGDLPFAPEKEIIPFLLSVLVFLFKW